MLAFSVQCWHTGKNTAGNVSIAGNVWHRFGSRGICSRDRRGDRYVFRGIKNTGQKYRTVYDWSGGAGDWGTERSSEGIWGTAGEVSEWERETQRAAGEVSEWEWRV